MESPNTPTRSGPCASRADRGVTTGAGDGGATTAGGGALTTGALTTGAPITAAPTEAEALARSPSITVGLRSHWRPSGVSSRPAATPTRNATVNALTPARTSSPEHESAKGGLLPHPRPLTISRPPDANKKV